MPQPLTKKQLQEWSQRNGQAFNGLMDANSFAPISGDVQSGLLMVNDLVKGNYGSAALNGLGLLPFVPSMAGMFIGKGAKVWDVLKAEEAVKMAKAGVDPKEIWKKTGTFQGAEGAWRQEIPDNAAEPIMFGRSSYDIWKDMSKNNNSIRNIQEFINNNPSSPLTAEYNKGTTISAAYDNLPVDNPAQAKPISDFLSHDLLYSSYPDLTNIKAGQEKGLDSLVNSGNASFSPDSNFIKYSKISGPEQFKSTTLHELQHAIQEREGWARGGSPDSLGDITSQYSYAKAQFDDAIKTTLDPNADPIAKANAAQIREFYGLKLSKLKELSDPHTAYKKLAGEAEARATQARMNMTMPERLNTFPFDSYDVPKEQLIVRGLLGDSPVKAMSENPSGLFGRYGEMPVDELAKERALRVSGIDEDYRLPNLHNAVPKEYLPKQYGKDTITIYRGVPANIEDATIRPGDWIGLDKNYALQHGTGSTGKNKLIKMEVPADHVGWAGTDMNEYFYVPR